MQESNLGSRNYFNNSVTQGTVPWIVTPWSQGIWNVNVSSVNGAAIGDTNALLVRSTASAPVYVASFQLTEYLGAMLEELRRLRMFMEDGGYADSDNSLSTLDTEQLSTP